MFTPETDQCIASLGEAGLIQRISDWLGPTSPDAPEGMGDDCAVNSCTNSKKQLLTTDSLTYRRHFDDSIRADEAGAKLIKRNLSDIAAMGGTPGPALLSLLSGPDLCIQWLEDFIYGIRETCEQYQIKLVGGDVSELSKGQFSAVLTQTGHAEHPVLRSGASLGDAIYVTGSLGGSILKKHYAFEPRLKEGDWLANSGVCSAMMDLTDGLAKDLRELIPNNCSARLNRSAIPISDDAKLLEGNPLEHAFCDGEDYELLFTTSRQEEDSKLEQRWEEEFPNVQLTKIGTIGPYTGGSTYVDAVTEEALPWQKGFEHLSI